MCVHEHVCICVGVFVCICDVYDVSVVLYVCGVYAKCVKCAMYVCLCAHTIVPMMCVCVCM